jgi:hypothetical protein
MRVVLGRGARRRPFAPPHPRAGHRTRRAGLVGRGDGHCAAFRPLSPGSCWEAGMTPECFGDVPFSTVPARQRRRDRTPAPAQRTRAPTAGAPWPERPCSASPAHPRAVAGGPVSTTTAALARHGRRRRECAGRAPRRGLGRPAAGCPCPALDTAGRAARRAGVPAFPFCSSHLTCAAGTWHAVSLPRRGQSCASPRRRPERAVPAAITVPERAER